MKLNKMIIIVLAVLFCSISANAIEIDDGYYVKQIEIFNDPRVDEYTLDELKDLIEYYEEVKIAAFDLAELAIQLGWPQSSATVRAADVEYNNAIMAIKYYTEKYNEAYAKSEEAKWDKRFAEYPAATYIWLYMKEQGWNDYVCAGIMGNMMAEVGGQTLDLDVLARSSNKNYYGICQWSKKYYPEVQGKDLAYQCNFLNDTIAAEFNTFGYTYKKKFNFNSFLNLTNAKEAALAFAKCYERCSSSTYSIRQANAIVAYNYFVNN